MLLFQIFFIVFHIRAVAFQSTFQRFDNWRQLRGLLLMLMPEQLKEIRHKAGKRFPCSCRILFCRINQVLLHVQGQSCIHSIPPVVLPALSRGLIQRQQPHCRCLAVRHNLGRQPLTHAPRRTGTNKAAPYRAAAACSNPWPTPHPACPASPSARPSPLDNQENRRSADW